MGAENNAEEAAQPCPSEEEYSEYRSAAGAAMECRSTERRGGVEPEELCET